ncbi:LPS export ABC transporter permease LptF [Gemmobacter fulvus]|uniref:LPS export ABC transporter permease LptF n=1 Tax=Gemmobacter fulvus TaxID=2840474 RepID=A0A975P6N7_9RHOB|nr:LPS export ABC transporter permease LptF [Gemmobacter fulvus]MBT9245290.1 LPS export ABC transporter permease LptF [Gemmobacter fulvus]QWK90387.1 LPS export ABC transporter permease LptF [Gemmobacter fulvus]
MSRFDRYLLSHLLALFGFFSLVLVAIYWVNRAVGLFDQLIGDGQSALVFLEFSLLTLPNVIRLVLPISAFAATVYGVNRLMADSELVVMQATGFSSFRLARPVLYFGLCVALMMLVLMHVLVPASRAALTSRSAEIAENVTSRYLSDGEFMHPSEGITLYIRDLTETGELLDVFIADDRDPKSRATYTASRALLVRGDSGPKLIMFDGMVQSLVEAERLAVTRFADFTYDLGGLIDASALPRRTMDELSTRELLAAEPAVLQETGQDRATFRSEAHARFAMPFLGTAAALIGFSALLLGAFSRFGLWRQIGIAVLLIILVQLINTSATGASLRDERAWPLVYAAPVFGLVLSALMLWQSQRPRRRPRQTEAKA